MHNERFYYVYIMSSQSGTLYLGFTNNLIRRVLEHKLGKTEGFTKQYQCHKLVYFEQGSEIHGVIMREKELKGWKRSKKVALIHSKNPEFKDLSLSIGITPNMIEH